MGPGIFRGPFFFPGFCREHHRGPLIAPKQRGCHETRHMLSYSVDEGRCRDHSSEDLKRTAYKRSARPAGRRAPLVCVWGPIRCSLSPSYLARNPMQAPSPPPTDTACPSSPIRKGEGHLHREQRAQSEQRADPEKQAEARETGTAFALPLSEKQAQARETGTARFSKQLANHSCVRVAVRQATRSVAPDTSARKTSTHRETDCVRFSKQLASHQCVRVAVPHDTSARETSTARFPKEREAFPDTRPLPRGQNGHGGCNAHRTPLLGSPPMMRNAVARMVGSRFRIPLQRREPASRACMART